jgi:putative FmdB family regulatory protein
MPLHDYTCRRCGHRSEELTDGESLDCPLCGGSFDRDTTPHTFASPGQRADLDQLNHAAFGTTPGGELKKRLGSTAGVERELERRGLGVMTPDEVDEAQEEESDRYATLQRAAREGGEEAALALEDKWEQERLMPIINNALAEANAQIMGE